METTALNQFIVSDALIMVPVLYIIGIFLRQTPRIPFWTHAWIKMAFGITACMIYFGPSITSFVQGILVAGAAVLLKDIIHHRAVLPSKPKKDDNIE